MDQIDAAAIALGAEGDRASIWRKRGLVIVGGMVGEPDGVLALERLNPDIQIAFSAAIGSVGDLLGARGERGFGVETGVERDLREVLIDPFEGEAGEPKCEARNDGDCGSS